MEASRRIEEDGRDDSQRQHIKVWAASLAVYIGEKQH